MEFIGFGKIPRLSKECIITEKIDGTNAQIYIAENCEPITLKSGRVVPFLCGSRTRWIFPENDNAGFATWAYNHVCDLLDLGPGSHFGEWWGAKIGRKYDLDHKRFSLFNVGRWADDEVRPACCHVVPTLWSGDFDTDLIEDVCDKLKLYGSVAAPGFMKPEGIIIYHTAAKQYFKKPFESLSKWELELKEAAIAYHGLTGD
jgi:hypothetical protein